MKQEPGLAGGVPRVYMGKFGDIKKLMRGLSKRDTWVDLELICKGNDVLHCHRFIIGAQSKFLRNLMLSTDSSSECCRILFPDVERCHMETVLQFLYTGRMKLQAHTIPIVRQLLEKVLRIDADFKLPDTVPESNQTNKDNDQPPPPPNPQQPRENEDNRSPPKKRFRPAQTNDSDNNDNDGGTNEGTMNGTGHLLSSAPMTPPHVLDEVVEEDEEEVEVLANPKKPRPVLVDLSDDEGQNVEETRQDNGPGIVAAPSVIAKSTAPRVISQPRDIAEAPKCVAKSTGGGPFRQKRKKLVQTYRLFEGEDGQPVAFQMHGKEADPPYLASTTNVIPAADRSTRTSTGSLPRTTFSDDWMDWIEQQDFGPNVNQYLLAPPPNMMDLPAPLPQPPEPGLVIHRGQWVKPQRVERLEQRRSNFLKASTSKVRKHKHIPWTCTGKTMASTLDTLNEPEGVHECHVCGVKFNKLVSLTKHMGRVHNPRLVYQCPECPKRLSTRTSIRKHLLSHRPEGEWPFVCEFCGKRFQAKADLPKHFFTRRHINDPKVPKPGTQEWTDVLNRSCILPTALFKHLKSEELGNSTSNTTEPSSSSLVVTRDLVGSVQSGVVLGDEEEETPIRNNEKQDNSSKELDGNQPDEAGAPIRDVNLKDFVNSEGVIESKQRSKMVVEEAKETTTNEPKKYEHWAFREERSSISATEAVVAASAVVTEVEEEADDRIELPDIDEDAIT